MPKHGDYVYVDFILNDIDHKCNDGYENDYGIHIWSWKYDDDLYIMNDMEVLWFIKLWLLYIC